jgi:adenosyl cobinamide kinase/adenosyl cobinamide phosphate guanylyltransferase
MAEITLVTGGCRSGKSSFVVEMAKECATVVYVATAEPLDNEMSKRIRKHKKERPASWKTVEEPVEITQALKAIRAEAVIVDCLTLWVSNLMRKPFDEAKAASEANALVRACRKRKGLIFLVTNETGLGIVPADPCTRLYRDCLGRINQIVAREADNVILMVSGIPLVLKGKE